MGCLHRYRRAPRPTGFGCKPPLGSAAVARLRLHRLVGVRAIVEAALHARLAAHRFEILRAARDVDAVFDVCHARGDLPFAD